MQSDVSPLLAAYPSNLEKLDIHHHYVSDEVVTKLKQLGITVDASDRQIPDDDDGEIFRYVAVSE